MKLRTLIWAGATAYASFKLVSNRKEIAQEYKETKTLTDQAKASLANIQKNLDFIQSQVPVLEKVGADLSYKLQVFQKETEAHLAQMPLLHYPEADNSETETTENQSNT